MRVERVQLLAIAWGMNGIKKRSDIVSLEGAVACYLCMDGIKKRSDCVDQGLRGCSCLGLGHHLQEELSYITDGSNVRVNYTGIRIVSLIRLLKHQTIFPCKVHSLLPDSSTVDQ